jgi:hypothetical protein
MPKNTSQEKYLYPATPATIHKYAASIFGPVNKRESVTAVWVSMSGRRMWNKFLIENIDLFKKELPDYQKNLLVYIEPLDLTEDSQNGYLRLMGKDFLEACRRHGKCKELSNFKDVEKVFDNELASYSSLLQGLNSLLEKVAKAGFRVTFFLGEFDELGFANTVFYNNLKSLWDDLKGKLCYVFLTVKDLTTPEATGRLGELNEVTLQNIVYVPIRQGEDIDYLIDFFRERLNHQFGGEERELIKKLCGGHPYLIKAATRIMANFENKKPDIKEMEAVLTSHYEVLSVVRRIFHLRTEEEKEILTKIAFGRAVSPSSDLKRLINLGLVKEEDGRNKLFGDLLEISIREAKKTSQTVTGKENEGLYLNEGRGAVCYGGVPVEEQFTGQEYNVIKFLLDEPNKLRTRDEISNILWGEESYEKYSDWAIDQVISKIRKKLKKLGTKTQLVTLRGRGYKLVSN